MHDINVVHTYFIYSFIHEEMIKPFNYVGIYVIITLYHIDVTIPPSPPTQLSHSPYCEAAECFSLDVLTV